ncbi:MAG TPA: TAT-variant-translocated molybdopterin oxidoreductase [Stellaceae bacterium]|jgi:molybdopterin-containing oxidoreductase family iron-sulfur binding subunit|nr:TAT-variant-translocated molybdopterin oxidoreductase [Stellaceae bacterium]
MTGRFWWRSLAERADDPAYLAAIAHEFPEPQSPEGVDRRRFLQLMAASAALSGLGGCSSLPAEHVVPRVEPLAGEEAGVPRYVATALVQQGYATGAILQHRDGRPVKLEGNPDHPASLGASDATMQAAVLDLYDPERSAAVLSGGRIVDWEKLSLLLAEKRGQWAKSGGTGLRILTGLVASPSLAAQLAALLRQYPNAAWHQWEPLSRDAVAAGATLAFGKPVEMLPRFDKADVVLAVESDAISGAPGHLAFARAFAERRRAAETGGGRMSRVYAIEATPTLIGGAADHRFALKPAAIETALRAIAAATGAGPKEWQGSDRPGWVDAVASDLIASKGAALVHAGPEQSPAIHALVHAINRALAAPVRYVEPVAAAAPGIAALTGEMHQGKVETLLILGGNPVYDAPADLGFAQALGRVKLSVQLGTHADETAARVTYHVPALHAFEDWGDGRAFDGTAAIVQPQIRPLAPGHSAAEMIALVAGRQDFDARKQVRDHWRQTTPGDFDTAWEDWLRQGTIPNTASADTPVAIRADFAAALPKPDAASGLAVLLRPDPFLRDGAQANNGWLQELPRPLTRLAWDNAALVAPATAERLGLKSEDVVEIAADDTAKVRLPVLVLPGQAEDCVTLPLGYGRTAIGAVGRDVGVDVAKLRRAERLWETAATLHPTGETAALSMTQHQQDMAGRDIVRTRALAEAGERHDTVAASLYPPYKYDGNAWGMAISLSSCIGCGACTAACQAENNIPVVGRDQVMRGRAMHWIRVDRYWGGEPQAPDIAFQPVPCMHCEDAPCEVVCPVGATTHDSDGLNVMVYNRCVGTRFCSNNCPYKVRRFNFYGYSGSDPRPAMAWNPDVTVRGRGVMEKCTYCIQRIRETKIAADRDDRPIADGEIVTACQQACPTQAIVFGDINDPKSAVRTRKASALDYALLEDLNTRPRTTYAARVLNRNPAIAEG